MHNNIKIHGSESQGQESTKQACKNKKKRDLYCDSITQANIFVKMMSLLQVKPSTTQQLEFTWHAIMQYSCHCQSARQSYNQMVTETVFPSLAN